VHPFGAQYFAPTLLTGVRQDAEIVQNEVFGPVLTLQTFGSDAEVVALANGVDYGWAVSATAKSRTRPRSPPPCRPGSSG